MSAGRDIAGAAEEPTVDLSLHRAAKSGDLQLLLQLISEGKDVDVAGSNLIRPIHVAAQQGNVEMIAALAAAGCDVDARAWGEGVADGASPLHMAAKHSDASAVAALIRHGANVNAETRSNATALHAAVWFGHIEVVKALISARAKLDIPEKTKLTPLMYAVSRDRTAIAELLIKSGADVHMKNQAGYTPLHFAADNGNAKLVSLLLRRKPNLNAKTGRGYTPLLLALMAQHWEVGHMLIQAGANVMATDEGLSTALHAAAFFGGTNKLVLLLLERGAHVNAKDKGGRVPLLFAVEQRHTRIANILLQHRAVVNHPAYEGTTPLHAAAKNGDLSMAKALVAHGAKIDWRVNNQRTPLHHAAFYRHYDVCKFLLEKGAYINAVDSQSVTPLHLAAFENVETAPVLQRQEKDAKVKTVEVLLEYGADVNAKQGYDKVTNSYDGTPLHLAIKCADLQVMVRLLERGACYDANLRSDVGLVPTLDFALSTGNEAVTDILNVTKQMFAALEKKDSEQIESCIRKGAIINTGSVKYGTPLMYASWKGLVPLARVLILSGADVNVGNSNNVTPLHYAAKFDHNSIVNMLLRHGAVYNAATRTKNVTPLNFAETAGNDSISTKLKLIDRCFEIVKSGNPKFLEELKAMVGQHPVEFVLSLVNCRNIEGQTLYAIAVAHENEDFSSFIQSLMDG